MSDPATQPIVVNGSVSQVQAQALLRQVLTSLGLIVAAFGAAKAAGVIGVLTNLAGPIVAVLFGVIGLGAMVWGQLKTRSMAKKSIALTNLLPDSLATTK